MSSSLSNIVNTLSERIHKIKCKFGHIDKKWFYECFFDFKDDLIEYKCLILNTNCQMFDKKLKERYIQVF